jgi:hypothetical protein
LPPSGIWGGRSAIIHRTIQCSTGLSGVPSGATATSANERLQRYMNSVGCARRVRAGVRCAPDSEQDLSGAPPDCSVTRCQKLQRAEPNDLVTWLAHRTVSGGAPDCPVRHTTEALTNGHFGGWGYKYPLTTTLQCIQVFSHQTSYKSSRLHSKTQTKRSNPLPTFVFF